MESLLSDNKRYAENWLAFWNDLLRNDYRGTGYIDGGRKQITKWLYSALLTNMPYDRFVAQLMNPNEESEGLCEGHRLARGSEREPNSTNAGGPEYFPGVHGRSI